MEHVARPYRQHPAQVIDAKPHEWVRSKGPDFNREAHRDGRDVQSIWILPDITVADFSVLLDSYTLAQESS